jgi:hypothetical protein
MSLVSRLHAKHRRRRGKVPASVVFGVIAVAFLAPPQAGDVVPTANTVPGPTIASSVDRGPVALGAEEHPPRLFPTHEPAPVAMASGGYMHVAIPAVDVDAPVIRLGLNPDGTLEVPSDYSVAGWWSGGPIPGDVGPAVIVGHIDNKSGPAVFYRLRSLKPGQVVVVRRPDGAQVRFAVERIEEVPKSQFPSKMVYGAVNDAELRLITCGGAFNYSTGHYVDNIIVFARLSSS